MFTPNQLLQQLRERHPHWSAPDEADWALIDHQSRGHAFTGESIAYYVLGVAGVAILLIPMLSLPAWCAPSGLGAVALTLLYGRLVGSGVSWYRGAVDAAAAATRVSAWVYVARLPADVSAGWIVVALLLIEALLLTPRRQGVNLWMGIVHLQLILAYGILATTLIDTHLYWLIGIQGWCFAQLMIRESWWARRGVSVEQVHTMALGWAIGLFGLIALLYLPEMGHLKHRWLGSVMLIAPFLATLRKVLHAIDLGYLSAPVLAVSLPILTPVMPLPGVWAALLVLLTARYLRQQTLTVMAMLALFGFVLQALLSLVQISWFTFGFLLILIGAAVLAMVMRPGVMIQAREAS